LLAYSKAGLFSLAVIAVFAVVAFFYKTIRKGLPVRNLVMLILAIFLIYFGVQYLLSGSSSLFSIDAMVTRLDTSDPLTSRTQIWQGYLSLWQSIGTPMVFKGIGFDTYASTYVWGSFNKCHNLYIETVTLFGVLGAVLIFAALGCYMAKRARGGATFMAFLPCIVLLATGLVLHGFLDFPFFYEWTVALGCLDYAAAEKKIGAREDSRREDGQHV
jgi:O-antigen ligase